MPPPASAEVLSPALPRRPFRAALFDFDGTLSLFREGWPRVMVGMMVEVLKGKGLAREPDGELWAIVEDFVMALNGRPSLVQIGRFADEIRARGGQPGDPREYLREYLDRLTQLVRVRWESVTDGRDTPEQWVVPHAHAILKNLQSRGVPLFVASGTDISYVRHEAELLRLAPFFGAHLYAPVDNAPTFSKRDVIETVLATCGIDGSELLGFGDGVVETQEVKRVGGVAVAVASAEPGDTGVNAWKRDRLAAAGADAVIPDYADQEPLVAWLFGEGE